MSGPRDHTKMELASGEVRRGTFIHGAWQGIVKVEYPGGSVYVGGFRGEFQHGRGLMTHQDGNFYDGDWVHGVKTGKAVMKGNHGKYSGDVVGSVPTGIGRYEDSKGNVYEGQVKASKPHGWGSMQWTNGSVYVGEWKHALMQGKGTYSYSTGEVYRGHFVKGKRHGFGVLKGAGRLQHSGQWRFNRRHGRGCCVHSDGLVFFGRWACDQRHGRGGVLLDRRLSSHSMWLKGVEVQGVGPGFVDLGLD